MHGLPLDPAQVALLDQNAAQARQLVSQIADTAYRDGTQCGCAHPFCCGEEIVNQLVLNGVTNPLGLVGTTVIMARLLGEARARLARREDVDSPRNEAA